MIKRFCGLIWLAVLLAFLGVLPGAVADPGTPTRKLKVAFFYSTSFFKDSLLTNETAKVFADETNVDLETIAYTDSNDFYDRCKLALASSNAFDLVLGPSDSDSLKTLDKALSGKTTAPFVAPFVTTKPKDYYHLDLISASPTDQRRVNAAVDQFAKYTAFHSLGCLYTDDPWGQGIANNFRDELKDPGMTVFSQPVSELTIDRSTGIEGQKDNGDVYRLYLEQMQKQGTTVIAVALLRSASINQFFDSLEGLNKNSWIGFKPTIILLNPVTFVENHTSSGVLMEYAKEFRIVYVRETIVKSDSYLARLAILPHLDACQIIAAVAHNWPPAQTDPPGQCAAVQKLEEFYAGSWSFSDFQTVEPNLATGFHVAKYVRTNDVDVLQACSADGKTIAPKSVDIYFNSGYWHQFFWKQCFFFLHHQSLWRPVILIPFIAVCFGAFLNMIWFGAMKRFWLIWKTRSFWLLFSLNFSLTYITWVISIRYGVFSDTDWIAPLLLAGLCPSAVSALSDLMKRFLPMFNLDGVFKILSEVNAQLLSQIGAKELDEYKKRIATYPLAELKDKFYGVLFLDAHNDSLVTQQSEKLKKRIDSVPNGEDIRLIYADFLVDLVAYLTTSRDGLKIKLNEMFPPAQTSPPHTGVDSPTVPPVQIDDSQPH